MAEGRPNDDQDWGLGSEPDIAAGAGISEDLAPSEPGSQASTGPADEGAGEGQAPSPSEGGGTKEAELYDRLLRLQAEFDNYRKRVDRQQRETIDNAATGLVKKLLPVLDTADLALAHGGGEDIKQLAGALFDVLSKEGLERVVPEGQAFDPEHHDAVAHEPAEGDDAPERPEVSEVMRAGYMWRGRVLRPAMVKVRG
ncbi:MAG TPA: nucleotide exchange factor GrpE [Acidimicrobiales bacterium]|nr:nucleotide exchange factor GrpE [Acidimicrobiales bacterium]